MRFTRFLLVLAMITLASILVFAQEKPPVPDLLRWFPEGTISEFGHYDISAAKKAVAYAAFMQMFSMEGDSIFGENPPLPDRFVKLADAITFARPESIGTLEERDAFRAELSKMKTEKMTDADKKALNKKIQELSERNEVQAKIWACTIPGLAEHLKKGLAEGTFSKVGQSAWKRPIYAVTGGSGRGTGKTDITAYACAAEENTLLIAPSITVLRSMVAAGIGQGGRMADQQDYAEAFPYLQDRGQVWKVKAERVMDRLAMEKMQRDGATDEAIQKKEKKMEKAQVFDMDTFVLGDDVLMQQMSLYDNEDAAKARFAEMNATFSRAGDSIKEGRKAISKQADKMSEEEQKMVRMAMGFAGNLMESQKTEIQGNLVTTSIVMGEKQLKTLTTLMAFGKMMEEKEAKSTKKQEKAVTVDQKKQ